MSIRLPRIAWLAAASMTPALVGDYPLAADEADTGPLHIIEAEAATADVDRDRQAVAEPAPGPAFPVGDMRFDIECDITDSTLPGWVRRLYEKEQREPPKLELWGFRESVDLQAMVSCGPGCTNIHSSAVAAADAERIVLGWSPGYTAWLRRSDGYYYEWYAHAPVETRTGQCRRVPFTEFPTPYEGDRWNFPDTRRAVALGARRFDLVCEMRRQRWGRPPAGDLPNLPEPDDIPATTFRQSVDLDAMLYCPQGCREPRPIRSAGPGRIRFTDEPDEVSWLDRQIGELDGRSRDAAGFESFHAQCEQAPFTPFPGSARTGEPGWRPSNPHKTP